MLSYGYPSELVAIHPKEQKFQVFEQDYPCKLQIPLPSESVDALVPPNNVS